MTNKNKELEDEIERFIEEREDNLSNWSIEYKGNEHYFVLSDLKEIQILLAELKGRQEARKETLIEVEKMINKLENKYNIWNSIVEKLRQSDRIGALEELKQQLSQLGDK